MTTYAIMLSNMDKQFYSYAIYTTKIKGGNNMAYTYKTTGTCSTMIKFDLDGDIVRNVQFMGGCNGNLQGVSRLVEGMKVDELEERLKGISCNGRPTSCPDQLARAVRQAMEEA